MPVDTTPSECPGPVTLNGRYGRIEKLRIEHAASLWDSVQGHNAIWTYMSQYGPFAGAEEFFGWVHQRTALTDPYSYAIMSSADRCVGIATLLEIKPAMRVIEVGHIVYSPALQRTPLGTEAQYLLGRYAFETLRYRRFEWKCNAFNAFEGILRQHMIAKGRNRDAAYFSMLDSEWPIRRANFERWLSPDNFTTDGRQILSLSALNGVTG
jgi:RimJ/RimL family protein N-acetyltransferase